MFSSRYRKVHRILSHARHCKQMSRFHMVREIPPSLYVCCACYSKRNIGVSVASPGRSWCEHWTLKAIYDHIRSMCTLHTVSPQTHTNCKHNKMNCDEVHNRYLVRWVIMSSISTSQCLALFRNTTHRTALSSHYLIVLCHSICSTSLLPVRLCHPESHWMGNRN